jgi:release factor glutamine methyltransferase
MQNPSKTGEPQWTILKLLQWTTSYFKSHNIESPRVDAEILLAHTLQFKRVDLYVHYDLPLSRDELAVFKAFIMRRAAREPVAYIVETKGFWSLDMCVTKDVLIPRPETECLVETALSLLTSSEDGTPRRILELGTGSGAIVLALASERPRDLFFASDRSIKAAALARKNAQQCCPEGAVCFFCGNWFMPLNRRHSFDMILSNPPYIRTSDIQQLQPEIYRHEPLTALDGGEDGLGSIRNIIRSAYIYLVQGGFLLLEIGYDQKSEVEEIIRACGGYDHILFTKDYAGHDRVVQMQVAGSR